MSMLNEFIKACPIGFCISDQPRAGQSYKYYVSGKGCTLGVLFEDTLNVYFEWLTEDGAPVAYPPEIRYKWFRKRDFTRLLHMGVWEVTGEGALAR
jgi:hypothetical protein